MGSSHALRATEGEALKRREKDLDFEAGGLAEVGGDVALAGFDAVLGDGEAEAGAAGVTGAGGFGTEEGLEEAGKGLRRDAGSLVGDVNDCLVRLGFSPDANGSGLGGVTDSVADDVAESAVDGAFEGVEAEMGGDVHLDGGIGSLAGDDGAGEFEEGEGFGGFAFRERLGFGEGHDFFDEAGHMLEFGVEFFEVSGLVGGAALFDDAKGHLHSGDG